MRKNLSRILFALFLIFLLFQACRNELNIGKEHQHSSINDNLKIRKLVGKDAQNISNVLLKHLQKTNNQFLLNKTMNGEIDYSEISEAIDSSGITNYTFRILNHPDDNFNTFHNLVLSNENDEFNIYMMKYEMDNQTALQLQSSGELNGFQGTVTSSNFGDGFDPNDNTGGGNSCNPASTGGGTGQGGGTGPGTEPGNPQGGGGGNPGDGGTYCIEVSYRCTNCQATYSSISGIGNDCKPFPMITIVNYYACRLACNPGGGVVVSPPKQTPCENIVTENTKAKEFIEKAKATEKKTEITSTLSTDTEEKSFSYGVDNAGQEQVTNVRIGTNGNAVDVDVTNPNFTIRGGAHTHTKEVYNVPSVGDLYNFFSANSTNSNFDFYHTFAQDSNDYVFTIANQTKFDAFTTNYPKATYQDGPKWKKDTTIANDFYYIIEQQTKIGKTDDEAYDLAMAFVLQKYGTGIAISKKDSTGNYKPLFVKENSFPLAIGTTIVILKTYEKTADCNY